MLLEFEFQNHLSFRNLSSFSTVKQRNRSKDNPDCAWDQRVNPVVVVYGANASGKSNLVDALHSVRELVMRGARSDESEIKSIQPAFLLDEESAQDSTFYSTRFIAFDGQKRHEYLYDIELKRTYIVAESLTVYRSSQPTTLFSRSQDSTDAPIELKFNRGFAASERAIIKKASTSLKPALAAASFMDESPLDGAFQWFKSNLKTYSAIAFEAEHESIKSRLHKGDEELRSTLLEYLREADLGICSIELNEIREEDEDRLRQALSTADIPESLIERWLADERLSLSLGHSTSQGTKILDFDNESEGTKAMLSFGSVASKALKSGSALIIDEIDTSLHPTLVRHLVRQFANPETNPKQAQLILTTHDLGLLTVWPMEDELLERDQIWFVEKDGAGISSLYSLADFSPRKDDNVLRRYLLGHYGAVPRVGSHD